MGGLDNWDPGAGTGADASKQAKLLSTEATDASDTMSGDNPLKRFVGKSSKPQGPFGVQGNDC